MKNSAQVVVIGGGVVGCSVLYHLTKKGWSDVVLVERSELTSGSTWHAAGGMHTLNNDPVVAKLQKYTIDLYQEIQEISGQDCGVHRSGGYMLADTDQRVDVLKQLRGQGRYMGIDVDFVDLAEVAERVPIVDTRHFVAAMWDPNEGHVDPWGVTNAYAKSAQLAGAEVYRQTKVESLEPRPDGSWSVNTDKGSIHAEIVVNAAGLWAREVGRMVGLELPVLAMEHHYLVSDEIAEIAALDYEMPHCIDFGGEIYVRQEGKGMLLGTYEQACVPWSPDHTPWDFGHELLEPDMDRVAESLEVGFEHFPPLAEAGIKRWVNGPFTFSPDGNPLIGPVPGLQNFYAACAVMAGFSQGGGVGLVLSNWIVDGDPGMDAYPMDVARFGDFATPRYTNAKVREFYSRRFSITYPNEELPAARPFRTTPVYSRLKDRNAVFGAFRSLEHPLWFAPAGTEPVETPTFRRSNAFPHVAEECRAVREGVGVNEISTFARHEVAGPGARPLLDRLLANRLPKPGRIALTPMLNHDGTLMGDLTVANLGNERYWLFGSGAYEDIHQRWFTRHDDGSTLIRKLNQEFVGLSVAGPKSRDTLQALASSDLSREAFPFRSFRRIHLGMASVWVSRLSFTGELGYELWMAPQDQVYVFDQILAAGEAHGIRPFGLRALQSMRFEKSYGAWLFEYRQAYTPTECGLDQFVRADKGEFIGRQAFLEQQQSGAARRLVTFVVDTEDVDCNRDEAIWCDLEVVGWVTSGGYGHCVGQSIALGYVAAEVSGAEHFEIEILGERCAARRVDACLWDPEGERMRA